MSVLPRQPSPRRVTSIVVSPAPSSRSNCSTAWSSKAGRGGGVLLNESREPHFRNILPGFRLLNAASIPGLLRMIYQPSRIKEPEQKCCEDKGQGSSDAGSLAGEESKQLAELEPGKENVKNLLDNRKIDSEDSREVNLLKMLHKADCTDNRSTWCEMEKSLDKMAKNTSDGTEKCNWKLGADVGVKLLESDGGTANLE
nr:hypothetical protein Iba_chr14cCG15410 [Ipomoea batatas]